MSEDKAFTGLDELTAFLLADMPNTKFTRARGYFYRLIGTANLDVGHNQYSIKFLGTNHAHTPDNQVAKSEIESADKFVAEIDNELLLIESCCPRSAEIEDSINVQIRELAAAYPDSYGEINTSWFECDSELGYTAEMASKKSIRIINMDQASNPKGIPILIDRFGAVQTIGYLLRDFEDMFETREGLNEFLCGFLKQYGIQQSTIESTRSHPITKKILTNDMRDEFMTSRILDYLTKNQTVHFAAHTMHVISILGRLPRIAAISGVNVTALYTPEIMERDNRMIQEGEAIKQSKAY